MMKKIICLGGGSLYFRNVLGDLAVTDELNGSEVVLYDIDMERAELMAKCGQRLSDKAGANFKVHAVKNITKAIDGADFAIASIGGAGAGGGGFYTSSGLHMQDILISARYGIFQVVGDTCGPAAMMAAFRSIPIYLDICHEMEKRCPDIIFLNHSNPMAVLCRAMNKYSSLKNIIGICHGVQAGIRYTAEILGVPPAELDTVWIGTNHYYWFIEIYHKGKNLYPKLRKKMASRKHPPGKILSAKLSDIYGYHIVYPEDDHIIEFYPFLAQVKDGASLPYGFAESHHGRDVVRMFAEHGLGGKIEKAKEKPVTRKEVIKNFKADLDEVVLPEKNDDPTAGEGIGRLLGAITAGYRHVHIVNIPNKGVVPNLPAEAVLEVEGVTNSHGLRPVYMGEAPLVLKGMLEKIIAWEELVVDAGVKGDRNLAMQALMLDPAAIVPEKAERMLDELLANSKELLPQFKLTKGGR